MPAWIYIRSEPELWTVGHHSPDGTFHPDSDHNSKDDAARRTHWLNGGHRDEPCHGGQTWASLDPPYHYAVLEPLDDGRQVVTLSVYQRDDGPSACLVPCQARELARALLAHADTIDPTGLDEDDEDDVQLPVGVT